MSAIRACRTAALGGHVARCEGCAHTAISYNSCRNRHCPKCQGQTARAWMERRQADLLPVPYYHVVFTLPAAVAAVAFQNKAAVYDLLFRTAADTLLTIAAEPTSSSAASCCTSCPMGSTGSGTTGFSQAAAVLPTSQGLGSCSPPYQHRPGPMPSRHLRAMRRCLPAPAAEDGSSSSSASAEARCRGHARPPSGSTRHDCHPGHDRDLQSGLRGIADPPRIRSRSRPQSRPRDPPRSARSVPRQARSPHPTSGRSSATHITPGIGSASMAEGLRQISISHARPGRASPPPRFPPLEVFERRPRSPVAVPCSGRHPKPFTGAALGSLPSSGRWNAAAEPPLADP